MVLRFPKFASECAASATNFGIGRLAPTQAGGAPTHPVEPRALAAHMNGGASTAGKAEPWPTSSPASPHASPTARQPAAARRMVRRARHDHAATFRAGASTRRRKLASPRAHTDAPVPDRRRLYADMAALFQQDLANVEAGIYPVARGPRRLAADAAQPVAPVLRGSAGNPPPP